MAPRRAPCQTVQEIFATSHSSSHPRRHSSRASLLVARAHWVVACRTFCSPATHSRRLRLRVSLLCTVGAINREIVGKSLFFSFVELGSYAPRGDWPSVFVIAMHRHVARYRPLEPLRRKGQRARTRTVEPSGLTAPEQALPVAARNKVEACRDMLGRRTASAAGQPHERRYRGLHLRRHH